MWWAWHCTWCWISGGQRDRWDLCPHKAYSGVGETYNHMVKFYEGIVRNPRRGQVTGVVRDGFPEEWWLLWEADVKEFQAGIGENLTCSKSCKNARIAVVWWTKRREEEAKATQDGKHQIVPRLEGKVRSLAFSLRAESLKVLKSRSRTIRFIILKDPSGCHG